MGSRDRRRRHPRRLRVSLLAVPFALIPFLVLLLDVTSGGLLLLALMAVVLDGVAPPDMVTPGTRMARVSGRAEATATIAVIRR